MKVLSRIAIAAALALVCLGGFALWFMQPPAAAPGAIGATDAGIEMSPGAPAARRGFLGVVIAGESVEVAARMSGLVTEVHVRLGDEVAEGGVIAELDDEPVRNELDMARATLRAARSAADKASLEVAEARERLERWERMAESSVVSPEELAGMRYKAKYAAHEHEAARARVAEAEARVSNLMRQLANTTVRAPFAGRVAARYMDAGTTVGHGQPIVRLVRAGELWTRFAVPEERGAEVHRDLAVEVRIEELDVAVTGVVEKVAPEVDAISRMLIVEARLEVPEAMHEDTLAGRVARVFARPKQPATP